MLNSRLFINGCHILIIIINGRVLFKLGLPTTMCAVVREPRHVRCLCYHYYYRYIVDVEKPTKKNRYRVRIDECDTRKSKRSRAGKQLRTVIVCTLTAIRLSFSRSLDRYDYNNILAPVPVIAYVTIL